MSSKPGKSFTVQPPDLAAYTGQPLRRYLTDLSRWLRQFAGFSGEPGGRKDRYIAVTSGTITANAGINGPMGFGDVVYRKINGDFTLAAKDTIEVRSLVLDTLPDETIVIVERIEGVDVITSAVCP